MLARVNHIIFQPGVNRAVTRERAICAVAARFVSLLLLSGGLLSAGCSTPVRQPLPPWTSAQLVAEAAPHDQPGLWSDGETTLLAWPGEPALPGIRLVAPGADPQKLPLGRVPRQVRLLRA